jgi:hypothetical protein
MPFALQMPAKVSQMKQDRQVFTVAEPGSVARGSRAGVLVEVSSLDECPFGSAANMVYICATVGQSCFNWLRNSSVSAELAEVGYGQQTAVAMQQLRQLLTSMAILCVSGGLESADPGSIEVLARQLQETGKALSCLAVPVCCNNPACVIISRTLEASLISGKSGHTTKCSQCKGRARYCCRACQKQDWKRHKPVCEALAAAACTKGGDCGSDDVGGVGGGGGGGGA